MTGLMSKLVVSKVTNKVITCSQELGQHIKELKAEAMDRAVTLNEPFFLDGRMVLWALEDKGFIPSRKEEVDGQITYHFDGN